MGYGQQSLVPSAGAEFTLTETRVWSMRPLYTGMSPASPHTYLLRWGGLALTQSEGGEASSRYSSHANQAPVFLF